jgi:hypothetical protein
MHTPEANSYSSVGKLWKLNQNLCTTAIVLQDYHRTLTPKRNKNKDLYEEKTHTKKKKKKKLKCQKVEAGYSNRIGTEKADRALHEGVPAVYVHHRCCYLPLCDFLSLLRRKNATLLDAAATKSLQSSFSQLRKREKDDRAVVHEPRQSSY